MIDWNNDTALEPQHWAVLPSGVKLPVRDLEPVPGRRGRVRFLAHLGDMERLGLGRAASNYAVAIDGREFVVVYWEDVRRSKVLVLGYGFWADSPPASPMGLA